VPLVEAAKLVVGLEKFAPRSISTHMAAFDTASRRRKPLMALQVQPLLLLLLYMC